MSMAKDTQYRLAMAIAAIGRSSIWPLAKLTRTRSYLPHTPLFVLNLVKLAGTVITSMKKPEALRAQSFPPMVDDDPFDILNASYPPEMSHPMSICEEDISKVIKSHKLSTKQALMIFSFSFCIVLVISLGPSES
jgi:hypothetical protein